MTYWAIMFSILWGFVVVGLLLGLFGLIYGVFGSDGPRHRIRRRK